MTCVRAASYRTGACQARELPPPARACDPLVRPGHPIPHAYADRPRSLRVAGSMMLRRAR